MTIRCMFVDLNDNINGHKHKRFFYMFVLVGARCSSVVRAFAHGAMGRWIDLSW